MNRPPRIGLVIGDTDLFIRPIEAELRRHYRVTRFVPRVVSLPVVRQWVNHVLHTQQLSSFMRRNDLVFFEWAGEFLVKATRMRKACPIVTRLHSYEVAETASGIDWAKVDATMTVTEFMKQRLLEVANVPPRSLCVVQNGVDLERFHPCSRVYRHRIGMACRVVTIKRVYEAVLCLYELRRQGYPFTLDIAGRIEDEREPRYPLAVLGLVDRLGLTECVYFRGHVSDMAEWYRGIDVFLSNSFWESGQNALKEAMASACNCLSHRWGGAEEVLPPAHLFITDSELRDKLIAYSGSSEEEKAEAQAEMRAIAEAKFDARRMVQEIVGLVEQVLQRVRP